MKKKLFYILFLIFLNIQNGFCLISEILDTVKWVAGQFNEITEEVFRKSMVAKTIESVSLLQKNYEDSMRFYNEIKRIQENPYGFAEDVKQEFLRRLENPVDKFWSEVDRKKREIDMKEDKKWYEKGIASYVEENTLKTGLDYVKENWNFGDKIVEKMKGQNEQMKKIVEDMASNDKDKIERAKNQLLLLQLEQQQQQTALLLRLFELQNKQIEEQMLQRQLVLERQKLYAKTAQEILQSKRQQIQDTRTREQKIKQYLRAISDKEIK